MLRRSAAMSARSRRHVACPEAQARPLRPVKRGPFDCPISYFSSSGFRFLMRDRRMLLVGDSMMSNLFEALLCSISSVGYEGQPFRRKTKGDWSIKGVHFPAFSFSLEYYFTPYIVRTSRRSIRNKATGKDAGKGGHGFDVYVDEMDPVLEHVLANYSAVVFHSGGQGESPFSGDCTHWCLPGIPDMWVDVLYTHMILEPSLSLYSCEVSMAGGRGRASQAKRGSTADACQPELASDGGRDLLVLEVVGGPCCPSTIAVTASSSRVGRVKTCQIPLKEDAVSEKHACVSWDTADRSWRVVDLGSSNGTSLNGVHLPEGRERPLSDGDEIRFGPFTIVHVHIRPSPHHGSTVRDMLQQQMEWRLCRLEEQAATMEEQMRQDMATLKTTMVQFSSPMLDAKQLQQCLDPIYKLTERDIAKPTPEVMRLFYDAAIRVLVGRAVLPSDGACMNEEEAERNLDFPELHVDAASTLLLFQSLRDLFAGTGVEWFAMRDLIRPDPERTQKLLSALANYKRFGDQFFSVEAQCLEDIAFPWLSSTSTHATPRPRTHPSPALFRVVPCPVLRLPRSLCSPSRHGVLPAPSLLAPQLSSELQSLEERQRDEDAEVAEVAEEVAVMEKELQRVQGEEAAEEEQLAGRREAMAKLMDEIAAEKQQAAKVKEEEMSLRAQIVESPDKVRLAVTRAEEAMESEKEARDAVLVQMRENRKKLVVVRKALAELQSRLQQVKQADQEAAAARELKRQVAARQAQGAAARQLQAAAEERVSKEKAKEAEWKAKVAARRAAIEQQMVEVRRKQEDVRVLEQGLAEEEELFLAAKAEVQGQLEQVRGEDERCQELHRQRLVHVVELFNALNSQVDSFHRRVAAYMDPDLDTVAALSTAQARDMIQQHHPTSSTAHVPESQGAAPPSTPAQLSATGAGGGPAPSGVSQVDAVEPVEVAVGSGPERGTEPGGTETGGAAPGGVVTGGAVPGGAEPGGAVTWGPEPGGAEPRGAEPEGGDPAGAPSPQRLREWYARRCGLRSGAPRFELPPAGGAAGATGGSGAVGGAAGAAGGTGAPGGAPGATSAVGGSGAAGGAAGATGGAAGGSGAAGGAAGAAGGTGATGAPGGTTGAAGVGAAAGGSGSVSAGSGGTSRPRPYFVPLLRQVLSQSPPPGPAPSLDCPSPVRLQSLLQPTSPLPGPSPYTGPTGGLTERREPESRPVSPTSRSVSPVRATRPSRRVPRQRPPAVPGTHPMLLRLSTAPQRVSLPSPPASSLPALADPESDSAGRNNSRDTKCWDLPRYVQGWRRPRVVWAY
ncbi:unnamed protein product [Closterium sp. NIES-54]